MDIDYKRILIFIFMVGAFNAWSEIVSTIP